MKFNKNNFEKFYSIIVSNKKLLYIYIIILSIKFAYPFLHVILAEAYRRTINATINADTYLLNTAIILAFTVTIVESVLSFSSTNLITLLQYKAVSSTQLEIFKNVLHSKYETFLKKHTSEYVYTISEVAFKAQNGFVRNLPLLVGEIIQIVLILSYLFWLSVSLTSLVVLIAVIIFTITPWLTKITSSFYQEVQLIRMKLNALMQESFQGAEDVRTFKIEKKLTKHFDEIYYTLIKLFKKNVFFEALLLRSNFLITSFAIILVLYIGGKASINKVIDTGTIIAFIVSFEKLIGPISSIGRLWGGIIESIANMKLLSTTMLDIPQELNNGESINIKNLITISNEKVQSPNLELINIHFGYDQENRILNGINLEIDPGFITALIGESGSGKTTLIKLLLRLYEPTTGEIICNGININKIPITLWRSMIAYVSQDPVLLPGTIYDNLLYGNAKADKNDILAAAKAANIHDRIMSASEGYDTHLGEGGLILSRGEKQRISIARAILRKPSILILDEPTSALDNENELHIMNLMDGRTTLLVSHRLTTLKNAKKIYTLKEGTINERSHNLHHLSNF